jgi:uncharacterized protein YdeI (YjbR/CyaY-like superfamily)
MSVKKTFQGVLETMGTVPYGVVVRLPFNPREVWAHSSAPRAHLHVKGTIRPANKSESANESAKSNEGFPFSGTLLGQRIGGHLLLVTRKMQKGARVAPGGRVEIVIEPDLDERAAPAELVKLLRSDRAVLKWFDQLNFSTKRYIAAMIAEPKSAEARARRAEQWAERMMLTMESEREIPPILKLAFRAHPRALAGWESLTVNQRRIHLLSLFSSQSPETRAKRVEDAFKDAVRAGDRAKVASMAAENKQSD